MRRGLVDERGVAEHRLSAGDLALEPGALGLEPAAVLDALAAGAHNRVEDALLLGPREADQRAAAAEDRRGTADALHRLDRRGVLRLAGGPGAEDQPPGVELRPDLLGDVRDERMEQPQEPLERRERGRGRGGVARVQTGLDRLGVPVAEVVEGEVVEPLDDMGEVEAREQLLDLPAQPVDPSQDPALLERARGEPRLDPLGVAEDQPCDVPELARELLPLLDRAPAEADVLGRSDLQKAVAGRIGAVPRHRLERVDAGAEALRHPPAVERQHGRGDDHVGEGHLAEEEEPREDHPVLPEADDLARGDVDVARVVAAELGRPLGPAEGREGPERRGEPGVEDVRLTLERGRAAGGTGRRRRPGARLVAVGAGPDRDLVAPPKLARDAPVGGVGERVDRELVLAFGVEADAPGAQRLERGLREALHRTPPLGRDERLDARVAALAGRDRVADRLAFFELAVLLEPGDHPPVGLGLAEPLEALGAHAAVGADHGQRLEPVVAADLEVDGVVAGRDLERARAEAGLDALVGDDRNQPPDHRHHHPAPDRLTVARVVGVDRDGDVGEDRRGTDGRDRDRARAVEVGVADVDELVVGLDVLDLEVGDRGLVVGAPVDDALGAVDEAGVPERDEGGHDRFDVGVVHREALAGVVERAAELAELAHDRAPGRLQPRPGALEERVAPDRLTRAPLGEQLLLDDVLGRDAGVVVARLPERVEPAHAVPADQAVLHRAVERVAHVQLAGDVRRRDADDEALGPSRARAGGVEALLLPAPLPALLDLVRFVAGLHHRTPILCGAASARPVGACARAGAGSGGQADSSAKASG